MTRVLAVTNPIIRTPRGPAPKYDLEPARRYGELHILLPEGPNPFNEPERTVEKIIQRLEALKFCASDYLLLAGNPTLGAWAFLAASQRVDTLKTLQWVRGKGGQYLPVTLQLNCVALSPAGE